MSSEPIPVAMFVETAVINLADPKASTPSEGPYVRFTVLHDGDEACVEVSSYVDENGYADGPLRFGSEEEILVFSKVALLLLEQTKGKAFSFESIPAEVKQDDDDDDEEEFDEEYDEDPLDTDEDSEEIPRREGSPLALPGWHFLGSEDVLQEGDKINACGDTFPGEDGSTPGWINAPTGWIGDKAGDWLKRGPSYLAARRDIAAFKSNVQYTTTTSLSQEPKPLLLLPSIGSWVYVRRTSQSGEWVRPMDYLDDTMQPVFEHSANGIKVRDQEYGSFWLSRDSFFPRKTTILDGEEYLVLEKGDLIREGDICKSGNSNSYYNVMTAVGSRVDEGGTSSTTRGGWTFLRKIKKA